MDSYLGNYMIMMMEETHQMQDQMQEPQSSSPFVFDIPGEPAIVIDGVPDISPTVSAFITTDTANESELKGSHELGEWLVGREVRKMFGDQYYSGKVVKFDEEMKWYRVEYEDGDFEDLEWCELKEVLLPLDIAISLKALALKIFKCEKSICLFGENKDELKKNGIKNITSKREMGEANNKTMVTKSEGSWPVKEKNGMKNIASKRETREENHKTLVTKLDGSWPVKEKNSMKNMTSKREMGEENHKALVTTSEDSWQVKENADYERTTQEKINRPKEIRRTINAEKQKRRIRNAIESNSAERKASNI